MELKKKRHKLEEFISSTPDPYSRDGDHITGSAWIIDLAKTRVLLTHHKKLNLWIQPGGHSEGETDPLLIAKREGEEETSLTLEPLSKDPFYFDIFKIPRKNNTPEHLHYDLTFIFKVTGSTEYIVSDESHDLKWVELSDIVDGDYEDNIVNMAKITLKRVIDGR